ncbi:MAG: hypothetical protein GEU86_22290 [Actinophytocola sp.]|nr:hypothetical protein [Actinophytocola sp.]
MTSRIMRSVAVLAAAAAVTVGLATQAHAAIVDRGSWSESGTDSFDDCGFVVDVQWSDPGSWKIQSRQPGSEAFYGSFAAEYRDVLTNPETGVWMVVYGKYTFREIKATHVEGDIYQFRQHTAGVPIVVEDSDGNVVLRDRGLVVWEQVFDTFGDGEPSGEPISFELVSTHDPHPELYMTDEERCAKIAELIG